MVWSCAGMQSVRVLIVASVVGCLALTGSSQAPTASVIGTGRSQGKLTEQEFVFFEHTVGGGQWAYLNHFWAAGSAQVDFTVFRYYVDGERDASVVFTPPLACGVGFGDQTSPWGTKWMGKGAAKTGWFHNIPIPFYKHVKVTYQGNSSGGTIWTIVRGAEGLPMSLGNLELPLAGGSVRLDLQVKMNTVLAPLEFYDMATVQRGKRGTIFMTSLFVKGDKNYNYMEGCFHMYRGNESWPGLLLSTGLEDYYDSAFYFDGGGFHMPISGQTHKPGDGTFSGYRFHESDPLVFSDGVRMQWRNGDVTDPATGLKCTMQAGAPPGIPAGGSPGHPTTSTASSYAWVYTWN